MKEASPSVIYHATLQPKNAESIEANGLLVGAHDNAGFSMESNWADDFYCERPAYLSMSPNLGGGRRYPGIVFEVDVSEMDLDPDLPTLVRRWCVMQKKMKDCIGNGEKHQSEIEHLLDGDGFITFDELLERGIPRSPNYD